MTHERGPQGMVELAADAGLRAIHDYLAHHDAKVDTLLILLQIEGAPPGERDTVTAASNVEGPKDVVALLASHFVEAARQLGLNVELIPVKVKGEG